MFVHCVYFWLRNDLSDTEHDLFLNGLDDLLKIESVRHGHIGPPASTDRPVIDRSYSYGLIVVCDDKRGHDLYQEDPIHDRFREECGTFWTDVKIYDLETEGK